MIRFLPRMLSSTVIGNIACVGIENAKILLKIASGDLSVTKGIDCMGCTTVSMIGGIAGMTKGAVIGAKHTVWIPVVGAPLAVATGFVGGMIGYIGGSKIGDAVYGDGKKVASAAKTVAKSALNGLKSAGRAIVSVVRSRVKAVGRILGF